MRLGRALVLIVATGLWIACDNERSVAPMEDAEAADLPRMQEIPHPPVSPGPQILMSLNGLTGDVQLAAGDNVTVTESDNTITIDAATASGPEVLYGYVHRSGYDWNVTPPNVQAGYVYPGSIWLSTGPDPDHPFDSASLVVTPDHTGPVSCTARYEISLFFVDCWDPAGNRVHPNFYFVMVGVRS